MKKNIMITLCIAILFMAVGYAAFSTTLIINGTANIASEWKVVFTKIEEVSKKGEINIKEAPQAEGTSATFNVGLTSPGDEIEYKITVENQGTLDAVIEDIKASETGSDAIIFKVENIKIGDVLENKKSTTFNVIIKYDDSITSQPNITTNELTITINYIQKLGNQTITPSNPSIVKPFSTTILNDNFELSDENIDFSIASSDVNGKGLYYTSTNTEDNKITYYFRGAVDNNYVQFGSYKTGTTVNGTTYNEETPIYWRIVRINEDGSVRLIYQGTSVNATGVGASIGGSAYNLDVLDNAYVGYMFGAIGQSGSEAYKLTHTNSNDSAIKAFLDDWYESHLLEYSSYLADSGFCNDRSLTSGNAYGTASSVYAANSRVETKPVNQQFVCENAINDLFTTGGSIKGNKSLTYPIGLLTVDEAVYAGSALGANDVGASHNYYLNSGVNYWTMSPGRYGSSGAAVYLLRRDGYFVRANTANTITKSTINTVRPVINLKSNVPVTLEGVGNPGTSTNPYIIKTN